MPHLKTRTDDSHAAPVRSASPRAIKTRAQGKRRLVRFPVYCRIKPHAPPFIQTPANLIKFPALRLLPRRGASRKLRPGLAQHPSLTAWTTRVSNPDRAPCFRGSAAMGGRKLPWPLGAHTRSANFTSCGHMPLTPPPCKHFLVTRHVAHPRCRGNVEGSLATLYAQSRPAMLSRRCITATAGTSLVRDSQTAANQCSAARGRPGRPHEDASSNFRSLTKIPHCCLWRGRFLPQVAGRPQSPARDRWLEAHS